MNYIKTAWRSIVRNKGYSVIYIIGLAVGFAVVLLDGLWIHDELSFNKYHKNYLTIAQVMHNDSFNGERSTLVWNPYHLGDILRKDYGTDFNQVVMSTPPSEHVLAYHETKFNKVGAYMDAGAPSMLSLEMISGSQNGLEDQHSILLSESVSKALFGEANSINEIIRIDNAADVKVVGVYRDLPYNSDFKDVMFIAPWNLFLALNPGIKGGDPWNNNSFWTYVQIADHANMRKISAKICDLKRNYLDKARADMYKPEVFLYPMNRWHLYSEFKNGVNTGGRIKLVWLFGIIGILVLALACVNFVNLTTASSQRRAKEIGIRKAIGSLRSQVFTQFFVESVTIVVLAFLFSLLLTLIALPFFNEICGKRLSILWTGARFWTCCMAFCLAVAAFAGIYPSIYLSSFQPVKVLKGIFQFSRFTVLQRQALVVLQFTVSVVLIVGTLIVFRQINFAKDREMGYDPGGLIVMSNTPEIQAHFNAFRHELKKSGDVTDVVESTNPTTEYYISDNRFQWDGKTPDLSIDFPISSVSPEYGRTIGWKIIKGRDFSKDLISDSTAFILNEAAMKFMKMKDPIGKIVRWNDQPFHVIGIIRDIVFESPYRPVMPSIYQMTKRAGYYVVTIKINGSIDIHRSLNDIKAVFDKYSPQIPFDYKFVDREYAKKFADETRIGKLASFFTLLAIFISCLGIFGLATLTATQRTKEIGIRKVLGSSVYGIWVLLSRDIIKLIAISLVLASPVAFYLMDSWLQNYQYHASISLSVFIWAGFGLLSIALLTVSVQIIRAAGANPVRALRTE